MPYAFPPALSLTSFTLRRKTASWFWINQVQGAPDASPNNPILLNSNQGRNGAGAVTLSATAYNYTTGATLGTVTAAFTQAGQISVNIPAAYAAPGANFQVGQGIYVEVLLSDASDHTFAAPQACYAGLGMENAS